MILPSIPADLAAAATVRMIRAAIGAAHRDAGADDPTAHDGVRRVLQGLTRQAVGRGRGQAQGLTADDCAAILATASIPRRTGRGVESETAAAERGAVDRAIVSLLFQGGLRRSEAAALRRRAGRDRRARRAGLRPPLENRPGRHRGGRALPQERVRRGASPTPRPAHCAAIRAAPGADRPGARRPQRPVDSAPPHRRGQAAGIDGRITGHSGRVGLASELTARGC